MVSRIITVVIYCGKCSCSGLEWWECCDTSFWWNWLNLGSSFLPRSDLLEQTFKALHFDVVLYKWLSVDDILSALRGTLRQRDSLEVAVCCIISRGTANHLLGTDSYGVGLHLDKVTRTFTADHVLAGKPKLFFIQRYSIPEIHPCAKRDHRDEDLETDGCDGAATYGVIPEDADVFWSHCWTDERQLGKGHHCSVYLKALTDALLKGQRRYGERVTSKCSLSVQQIHFHICVWL